MNEIKEILTKYALDTGKLQTAKQELEDLISTEVKQQREEAKIWYFEEDELVIKKGKWVIDRYKKHELSQTKEGYINGGPTPLTMTEMIEVSKDKKEETKRIINQMKKEAVEEFVNKTYEIESATSGETDEFCEGWNACVKHLPKLRRIESL